MKRIRKKFAFLVAVGLIICLIINCASCRKASSFTEEEHKKQIEQRLEPQIATWTYGQYKKHYDGFTVYPLYNENEELYYFLIELEPYGFYVSRNLRKRADTFG